MRAENEQQTALMKHVTAIAIVAALAAPAGASAAPVLAEPLPAAAPTGSTTTTVPQPQPRPQPQPPQPPLHAPADVRTDRRALDGYAIYLNTLLSATSSARTAVATYTTTIVSQCRSALAPLTQPTTQIGAAAQRTLSAIGHEIGDDLTISYDSALVPQFSRFSQLLVHLRWTRQSAGWLIVRRYVAAESRVLGLAPSKLCQDAGLVGVSPQLLPPGTASFLVDYNRASAVANRTFATLTRLMGTYTRPDESVLLQRIATLADDFATASRSDLLAAGSHLATALQST